MVTKAKKGFSAFDWLAIGFCIIWLAGTLAICGHMEPSVEAESKMHVIYVSGVMQ